MYRFEWSTLCEPALLQQVATAAGVADAPALEPLVPLLARALAAAGGLPLVERLPPAATRATLAAGILHDAVRHALAAMRPPPPSPGYVQGPSPEKQLGAVAMAVERVPINRADARTLARATRSTPALAEAIVDERRARGAFASMEDVDQRLRGVTARNRERIAGAVRIDRASDRLDAQAAITGDFAHDLATLVALQGGDTPLARLGAALEAVVVSCAAMPHPDTAGGYVRAPVGTPATPATPATPDTEVEWTGVLFASTYYEALRTMFAQAKRSIDVCMFHIALGGEGHPTRELVRALERARSRGVRIRVLVDRDREKDPYLSTIINAPARAALKAARVPVRSDTPDRLLHSKFVVVDKATVVIGSHNWSAGSYFEFDDLTLVLRSPALAAELTRRFAGLWADGT